jgi:hypothetical protein
MILLARELAPLSTVNRKAWTMLWIKQWRKEKRKKARVILFRVMRKY